MCFSVTTVDANMAAERDEVVGSARDEFRTKCELDVAAVTRITAFSDLTHDLVTKKPTEVEVDQEKHKVEKFTVLTNLVAVVECELDVAALTRITAFSDLTHNVVTKNPLRAGASKKTQVEKFTVLTNLVAVVDGEAKYVQAVILDPERRGKKVQSMKFPAKDLFDLAPDILGVNVPAWQNIQRRDGGFKTGPQDWTTRNCGKVDLSMCIC